MTRLTIDMARKGKTGKPKTTTETSLCVPFWEFFGRPEALPACRASLYADHNADDCMTCLEQKIAYEVFNGGCTPQTFMSLARAIQHDLSLEAPECSANSGRRRALKQAILSYCGAASVRDRKNALLLCTLGIWRGLFHEDADDLKGALDDFTKVIELDPPNVVAEYHIGVIYDYLATQEIAKNTRNKTECLHRAREKYTLALDAFETASHPRADMVRQRIAALADFQPGDRVEAMPFLPISAWIAENRDTVTGSDLEGTEGSWDAVAVAHEVKTEEPLNITRFETDDPTLTAVVKGVIEDNSVRTKRRRRVKKAVDGQFAKLLAHLCPDENSDLSRRAVRDKLMEHFRQVQGTEGTIKDELLKVLEFFGDCEGSVRTLATSTATKQRNAAVKNAFGKPLSVLPVTSRESSWWPRSSDNRVQRLSEMYSI
ncbi:hypothetical protein CALCODRAFT_553088 [Calocera cornea HHB12733]|uniref:Uncharacterized protein n=1 Tax=Calocera cornea HHB12733 TaxID=1353952 RepID=A0A165JAI7_9BASI|nr:hypothetical protein CALCODRAFT_553088 [Calocera cornea HHB12733]